MSETVQEIPAENELGVHYFSARKWCVVLTYCLIIIFIFVLYYLYATILQTSVLLLLLSIVITVISRASILAESYQNNLLEII